MSSPIVSICCLSLFIVISISSAPLTFVAGGASDSHIGYDLSFVTSDCLSSIVSGCFSSFMTSDGPFSAIFGSFLSFIVGSSHLSTIFNGSLLSAIFDGSLSSPVPPIRSRALFLPYIPSYTDCSSLPCLQFIHSFLPFLATLLAYNPTPFTKKRLFD